jgi:RHS repeat-associated protein
VPVAYHLRYVHTDALGSPVLETNADGQEIDGTRTQYEPYGAPLPTPHDGSPSYTGHQYDTGTGLIYAQQRYYDPQLGVFYSPDPMAVDTTSAFNFNRYAYAGNSPYKNVDPDGRFFFLALLAAAPAEAYVVAAIAGVAGAIAVEQMTSSSTSSADDLLTTSPIASSPYASVMNEATTPEGQSGGGSSGEAESTGQGGDAPASVDDILKDATPGRETMGRAKLYDKVGGEAQANGDFDSLGPTNVKDRGNGLRTGELPGGRKINVRPTSTDGRPTVEIQQGKNSIKIRYDN